MDADIRACWISGLWCGVAERLLVERLVREPPLTEPQTQHLRKLVAHAVADAPYLRELAGSLLAILSAAPTAED